MNSDTERSVKDILKRGWVEPYKTLGEGGWGYLQGQIPAWGKYRILLPEGAYPHFEMTVSARDDNSAMDAFHEIYNLDETPFEIQQVITTYRTVEEG